MYRDFSMQRINSLYQTFIKKSPILHSFHNWPKCFAQIVQGILHTGRNLRINGAADNTVGLHRPQAVGKDFLADTLQILSQLVKPPWALQQITQNQQFPFAPNDLYGGSNCALWQFFFCQHSDVLSYRFKFECYIPIIMQEQYLRNRLQKGD